MSQSTNTIGAETVAIQKFSCEITKITCEYETDEGKGKKEAVLYDKNITETAQSIIDENTGNVKLVGRISYIDTKTYYTITNHKGIDATLRVVRIDNKCTDKGHKKYKIIKSSLESTTGDREECEKSIDDGKIKLYYYNLFNSQLEYSAAGYEYGQEKGGTVHALVGRTVGSAAGFTDDYLKAFFRYCYLPLFNESDKRYYLTQLKYQTCPHKENVPVINIVSYPDISFKFAIDFCGEKNKYQASKEFNSEDRKSNLNTSILLNKKEITDLNVGLTVKYASTEKKLELGHKIEKKYDDKGMEKGVKEYEKYGTIYETFKDLFEISEKGIKAVINESQESLAKKWVKGSISFEPSLTIEWKYSVSDDLKKIGRYISIDLSAKVEGKITFNLTEIVKKIVITAAVGASGGTALVFKPLIEWLFNVISFIMDRWVDVQADFTFRASVEGGSKLTLDTSKEKSFEAKILKPVNVKISADLEIGVTIKVTFIIKAEWGVSGKAGANVNFELSTAISDHHINLRLKSTLVVGEIKLSKSSNCSFEEFDYSASASNETEIWSFDGFKKEFAPAEWTLFSF